MRTVHAGFSLFATEEQRLAAWPLLAAGVVDALEWTLDLGWQAPLPEWTTALLDEYAGAGRLYGHGVQMSPTTARFDDSAQAWLARLAGESRRYRHVTEHWGFSRVRGLASGAPMPLPACEAVVTCTIAAMRALAEVARVPVGLENLALAFTDDDVDAQPAMLARVLESIARPGEPGRAAARSDAESIAGVLLLDLHNVWCQAVNYERDVRELALQYPLARVRQLHVAGGGWSESAYGRPFRRDTHDALVPAEVLELVAWIVPRCPALEVVILERLPHALGDGDAWRAEWRTLAEVVQRAAREPIIHVDAPAVVTFADGPSLDELARFQDAVYATLLGGGTAAAVRAALLADPAAAAFPEVAGWELRALEVAIALAAKWGVRATGRDAAT